MNILIYILGHDWCGAVVISRMLWVAHDCFCYYARHSAPAVPRFKLPIISREAVVRDNLRRERAEKRSKVLREHHRSCGWRTEDDPPQR